MDRQFNNETVGAGESHELWYRYDWITGGLLTIAYSLVFVIGLIGNLLMTVAVLRGDREMRECVTNIFLVNLAVADLLVIITCLPFTLIANLFHCKYLHIKTSVHISRTRVAQ